MQSHILPFDYLTLTQRGIAYLNTQQYANAVTDLEQAKQLDPQNYGIYYHLAQAYLKAGYLQQASENIAIALNLLPGNISYLHVQTQINQLLAHHENGWACVKAGEHKNAIHYFNQALALSPYYHPGLTQRGIAYLNTHQYGDAITDLEQAKQLDPKNYGIYYHLALAYLEAGYPQQASENIAIALSLLPGNSSYLHVQTQINQLLAHHENGWACVKAGEHKNAIHYFNHALALSPYYHPVLTQRGIAYLNTQQYANAVTDLEQAKQLDPQNYGIYFHLAQAYLKAGYPQQASENIVIALSLLPGNSSYLHVQTQINNLLAHHENGWACVKADEHKNAIHYFNQVLAISPYYHPGLTQRGIAYLNTQQYANAVTDLEQAKQLDPQNYGIYYHLSLAYLKAGYLQEASENIAIALSLLPNNPGYLALQNQINVNITLAANPSRLNQSVSHQPPKKHKKRHGLKKMAHKIKCATQTITRPLNRVCRTVEKPLLQITKPITQPIAKIIAPVIKPIVKLVEPIIKVIEPINFVLKPVAILSGGGTVNEVLISVAQQQVVNKVIAPIDNILNRVLDPMPALINDAARPIAPIASTVKNVSHILHNMQETVSNMTGVAANEIPKIEQNNTHHAINSNTQIKKSSSEQQVSSKSHAEFDIPKQGYGVIAKVTDQVIQNSNLTSNEKKLASHVNSTQTGIINSTVCIAKGLASGNDIRSMFTDCGGEQIKETVQGMVEDVVSSNTTKAIAKVIATSIVPKVLGGGVGAMASEILFPSDLNPINEIPDPVIATQSSREQMEISWKNATEKATTTKLSNTSCSLFASEGKCVVTCNDGMAPIAIPSHLCRKK